jgi:hypothetical protein
MGNFQMLVSTHCCQTSYEEDEALTTPPPEIQQRSMFSEHPVEKAESFNTTMPN